MKNDMKKRSGSRTGTRSGVSLLISIVLISIVMVFAIGISNLVSSALRQTSNVNRSNQAFFAAEGALEQGLLTNQTKGAGYTAPATAVTLCANGQNCPEASVTIQGQVKPDLIYHYLGGLYNLMYGMPTPGTGTVGSNCSPLTAYYDKVYIFPPEAGGTQYAPWEHPCNWNKLKVGDSVAIPLYTVADDVSGPNCPFDSYLGYRVCNPVNLGLTNLVLRVRTPCIDGSEYCSASGRYKLNDIAGDPTLNGDDTILAWQITATSLDHKTTYTLKPITELKTGENKRQSYNTEISEGRINGALTSTTNPFTVLPYPKPPSGFADGGADLIGTKGKITSFLNNNNGLPGVFYRIDNNVINQPVLKLTLVHSLDEWVSAGNGGSIPYLEYQILTDSGLFPPADTSQTITAEGVSGTFKQVLEVKQPQETGLLEYVIQQ
jgi:hypothetical protein